MKLFFWGHWIVGTWSLPRRTIMSSSVSARLLPFLPAPADRGLAAAAGRGGACGAFSRSAAMSSSVNGSSGSLAGGAPLAAGGSGFCSGVGVVRAAMQGLQLLGGSGGALPERVCNPACGAGPGLWRPCDHSCLPWRGREGAPAAAGP